MAKATTEDKVKDAAWNGITGIPLVGSIANMGAMGVDLYNYGSAPGGSEEQAQAGRDFIADGMGFIPLLGSVTGYGSVAYDIISSDDTGGNLINRMLGGEDKYPTTVSEEGYNKSPHPRPPGPWADEVETPIPDYSDDVCE